jgi:hypothetical protein
MPNNNPSSFWKYYGLIAIVIVLGLTFAQNFNKKPRLRHYVVKVTSSLQDDDFENARLALEDSVFQSVNNAIAQNTKLKYSEALDNILPIGENIGNLTSGIVVVIQNNGEADAHNVQVEINLQAPIEKYEILSKETFSIVGENKSKGILKITIDKINSIGEITITMLLSEKYAVLLTASRTGYLEPPTLTTSDNPMQMIEMMAKQTEVATYNQSNAENLLQFQVGYDIDKIQPIIVISSEEGQSYFHEVQRNKILEQDLFIKTFLK